MMAGGGVIKPIDRAAVHRICSGQVVLDLATAVKELVENSLDAGARNIDIRLKEYGAELIEVADNGCGVAPQNHAALALKYHTSKISTFTDLTSLATFGFRGEALSSLCALADVTITTRTAAEPVATELVFDHSGRVASSRKLARAVGTTVAVGKLFSPLPVRYREFLRNVKREYGKLLTLLQAYALISTDVRLICTNQAGSTGRSTVIQTQGGRSVRDNIVTVFGTKFAASLEPVEISIGDSHKVTGFVSKAGAGCGRASGDRQFLFVNGRPVEMPKVGKLLNETYRAFNSLQYPMAVLNFVLPTDSYDVNVTPDKRKIFLHAEADLLSALRTSLEQLYAPDKYVYRVQDSQPAKSKGGAKKGAKRSLSLGGDEEEMDDGTGSSDSEEEKGGKESGGDSESEENVVTGGAKKRKRGLSVGSEEERGDSEGDPSRSGRGRSSNGQGVERVEERSSEEGREGIKRGLEKSLAESEAEGGLADQGGKRTRRDVCPEVDFEPGHKANGEEAVKKRGLADALEEEDSDEVRAGAETDSVEESHRKGDGSGVRQKEHRVAEENNDGEGVEAPLEGQFRKGGQNSSQHGVPEDETEAEAVEATLADNVATESERGNGTSSAHFGRVRSAKRTPVPLDAFLNVPSASKAAPEKAPRVIPGEESGGIPREESVPGKKPRQASLSGFLVRGKPSVGPTHFQKVSATCPDLRESEESDGPPKGAGEESADGLRNGGTEKEAGLESEVRTRRGRAGEGLQALNTENEEAPAGEDGSTNPYKAEAEAYETETEDDAKPRGKSFLGKITAHSPCLDAQETLPDAPTKDLFVEVPPAGVRLDTPGGSPSEEMRVPVDVGRVRRRWANWRAEQLEAERKAPRGRQFAAASLGRDELADLDAATNELERVFNKKDFGQMTVCGQFNLGFIIARLDNDLFIVDQHASDEKYNFERLVRTTVLNKQPLLNPLGLDLTAAEEVTCQEHLQAFRRNGFELVEAPDAPAGRRFRLAAVPFSKNITFGPDDVHELVSLLADAPVEDAGSPGGGSPSSAVRPSRVRSMLASRACRSSIMIGDPLNKQQMGKILNHLEGLDAPWNCPHGRPTMRHLVDLATLKL